MKKMKIAVMVLIVMWSFLLFDTVMGLAMSVDYQAGEDVAIYEMQATAYCLTGTTASGEQTRKGIVASKPEWIGKKMLIYTRETGEYIGTFEVKDTGGKAIRSGKVVDIWMPTYNECMQFGRKNVIVYLMD